MFATICPECGSRKVKISSVEVVKGRKWYLLFCQECPYDWSEEANGPESVVKENEPIDLEIDTMLLGVEIFETANECLCAIGFYERKRCRGVAVERSCLKTLNELGALLSRTEMDWGSARMEDVVTIYRRNISWALKELGTLAGETEGATSEKAKEIIRKINSFNHKRASH